MLSTIQDQNFTEEDFRNHISRLEEDGLISPSSSQEILSRDWEELQQSIDDVLSPISTTYHELLLDEFNALESAADQGYPPVREETPRSPVLFEVDPAADAVVDGPNGSTFRVTPIQRLRTVTVQKGYRREVSGSGPTTEPADVVSSSFTDDTGNQWFPGVRFFGEGIFITLEDQPSDWTLSEPANRWRNAARGEPGGTYREHLFRSDQADELNPLFVWWHTLSHLLIRALAVDAGYSSTSIRERVYINIDGRSGESRGGLILYATQPGSEGSLGGLIALTSHFDEMIQRSLQMAENCSNDPLCSEQSFHKGRYSGPACYSCLLLSETACEHRNLWLDRSLLLNNLP